MHFASYEFILFLIILVVVYYLIPRSGSGTLIGCKLCILALPVLGILPIS